jgi:hypothetical protein
MTGAMGTLAHLDETGKQVSEKRTMASQVVEAYFPHGPSVTR